MKIMYYVQEGGKIMVNWWCQSSSEYLGITKRARCCSRKHAHCSVIVYSYRYYRMCRERYRWASDEWPVCTRRRSSSGMPPGRRTAARMACSHWLNASGYVSRPPLAPFPASALPPPPPAPPLPKNDGGFNVKRRRASSAASGTHTMQTSIARRSPHECDVWRARRGQHRD